MSAKILLVDDNEAFIDSIKDILEDEGYDVVTANRGEAAVALARESRFDMILMDIKMPGMNGVESFLRMKDHNPDVRVILFTAYALHDLINEANKNGVCAVLKKPLDMDRLIKTIEAARQGNDGKCILVADDDREFCDNLYASLTESGYQVAVACDGQEAVREAESQTFDVLLVDLKMPKLNGLEVYRRVRKLQPKLVTILMTGYAEEMKALVTQALNENAYTLLRKPIDLDHLLGLLQKVKRLQLEMPS